jgi:D-alanine-D-alanine ligase
LLAGASDRIDNDLKSCLNGLMDKIAVLFGGRSGEHEISVLSAASMMDAADRSRHEIVPVGISKAGDWYHITADMHDLASLDDPRFDRLIPQDGRDGPYARRIDIGEFGRMADFAFPMLHGPYGEDGTVQGLFEMLGMPYAGCGVAASAISMDKIFTKELLVRAGLPTCRYVAVLAGAFAQNRGGILRGIEESIGFPVFVKPANMGSSVGVSRATDAETLAAAIGYAFKYDSRVIVEEAIIGRELEAAVLGNDEPAVGAVGEIIPPDGFYDYESKYRSGGAKLCVPADIPAAKADALRELAAAAFQALDGAGFSRVDFFLEEKSGKLLINEMNAIPGFTAYSMFPVLWKEAGVPYPALIERIIELGYERYHAKNHR